MVSRRAVLRAAPLAVVPLAGCGDLFSNPADQVSYDHAVRITNDDDAAHTVALGHVSAELVVELVVRALIEQVKVHVPNGRCGHRRGAARGVGPK